MYNGGKVIAGIIVFLGIMTFPFWYNLGHADYKQPKLQMPTNGAEMCVENTEWMRENHMQLLNQWRDWVVRDGYRLYQSRDNHKEYLMSLQNGCMKCHDSKEQFCDKCHDTAAVSPYCWDCHIAPKEK